jgi:hypothetical protein
MGKRQHDARRALSDFADQDNPVVHYRARGASA